MTTLDKELQSEDKEVPEGTSSYSEILPAWEQVFEAYKLQYKKLGNLVAADLSLSLKATAICVVCALLLIGIVLVTWSVLLIVVAYAMQLFNLHWLIIAGTVVLLNIIVLAVLKRVITKTSQSIGMRSAANALSANKKAEES